MMITTRDLDSYRSSLDSLANDAREYVTLLMSGFREQFPDAGVAESREAAKAAIDDALNAFGDVAGELAASMFEEMCTAQGFDVETQVSDVIDRSMVDEKVRWLAGRIGDIGKGGFDRKITDITRYYVKRSAFENMIRNCDLNNVMYARVPSGIETCGFCFMLSSNGFCYATASMRRARRDSALLLSRQKFCASMITSSFAAYIASADAGLSWMTPRLLIGTPVAPEKRAASWRS